MDNTAKLNLINDHRLALGYETVTDVADLDAELNRIEELAQFGTDPFEAK